MPHELVDKGREARDRAKKSAQLPGLEEAQEQLDPERAKAIEAMSVDALKRALKSPDMEQPANEGVRAKVVEVLSLRLPPEEMERLLTERGWAGTSDTWHHACSVWECVGVPGNLVRYSGDEFEFDQDSLRFQMGTPAAVKFDAKGKELEFSELICGYVGTNGIERLEGITLKEGMKREAVIAVFIEGTDLVIETETDSLRANVEELPENRYVAGEFMLNREAWKAVLKRLS